MEHDPTTAHIPQGTLKVKLPKTEIDEDAFNLHADSIFTARNKFTDLMKATKQRVTRTTHRLTFRPKP
jgi:hypothetical protein